MAFGKLQTRDLNDDFVLPIEKGGTGVNNFSLDEVNNKIEQLETKIIPVSQGGTGATTSNNALSNLNGVAKTFFLSEGTDLNTITETGFYRLQSNNLNGPTKSVDWCQMLVGRGGDTIFQSIYRYNDGSSVTRTGNPTDVGGAGSWTEWKENINTDGGIFKNYIEVDKGTDWAQYRLRGANGTYKAFEASDTILRLDNRNAELTTDRRFLDLRNSNASANVADALVLGDNSSVNGNKSYRIFGEHNKNLLKSLIQEMITNGEIAISGGGGIKSRQSGTVSKGKNIGDTANYSEASCAHSITLSTINPEKSFVLITDIDSDGYGPTRTLSLTSNELKVIRQAWWHNTSLDWIFPAFTWEVIELA